MPGDGWRYELIEGEIVASPVPPVRHQRIVQKLVMLLGDAERTGAGVALGPLDVVLDCERDVTSPDLLFIAQTRVREIVAED